MRLKSGRVLKAEDVLFTTGRLGATAHAFDLEHETRVAPLLPMALDTIPQVAAALDGLGARKRP